ncbi:hypothetical protein [Delftia acidovorans]|uniref:hypothetical protein n=1 Tax=Delftia acidovorans TaxID=80866 RepID=UPI002FDDEE9E
MNRLQRGQTGRSLVITALVITALAIGAAIYMNESKKSAEREAIALQQAKDREAQAARELEQARQAEAEREALARQAVEAAKQQELLVSGLNAADNLMVRWEDARNVATRTGRLVLAPPVAALQNLRREAKGLVAPPCLERGKEEMLHGMDVIIEGFLLFMQNSEKRGEAAAVEKFAIADRHFKNYRVDRSMCPAPSGS